MKIALVILHADPSRGGAERYTLDLGGAPARSGHQVAILASSFAATPESVASIRLDARGMTRIGRYDRFLESLDSHLNQVHYDIVHAMLPVRRCEIYHPHAGLAAAAVVYGSTISTLFNPRRARFAWVERQLLRSETPPLVLCLSDYVKQSIRGFYSLDEQHLPTLFNAVDLERFEPAVRPMRDHVNALIIAQDFQRKGLREAIDAMSKVNNPRLGLTVVGKESTAEYEKFATKLGVRNSVRFNGPTTDPRPFYRDADFFVLPTRHDPCSLVVLESLAMGVPVISTRFNGACEIMTGGVHGFVLEDPRDVATLADAMRKMLDPQLRSRMSQACLELRDQLSYDNHLRTLLEIYQRAASAKCEK